MPSRVIRGEILSSRSLGRVSRNADWLFHKLLTAADDFGRLDGRMGVLRAVVFPNRDDVTLGELERWLEELTRCDPDGRGPVHRYCVDGEPFIQLVNWEEHRSNGRRASKSRFPEPPELSSEILGSPEQSQEIRPSGMGTSGREAGERADPAAPDAAASRLGNLLGKLKDPRGQTADAEERALWLEDQLPVIQAAAEGGKGTEKELTIRYFKHYLARPEREFRERAKAQRERRTLEAWRAEHQAERDAERDRILAEERAPPSAACEALLDSVFSPSKTAALRKASADG